MTDLKYDYLFDENNHIVSHEEANSNNNYRLYKNEPLLYGYKESFERKNNVNVRGHFFLKTYNPMFTGTNESPEHYNAKMKIAKEKKYYDTIFGTDVFFDEVVVEKQVLGNKRPDILCYNNNELVCIIEILYTNEKTQEDIEKLKLNNVPLIEIDIKNENRCKHLILPVLLESNRTKHRNVEEEKSRIKRAFEKEYFRLRDDYEKRIKKIQYEIRELQESKIILIQNSKHIKIPQLNTFEIQKCNKGRLFKLTAVERVPNTLKWIGKEQKSHWLHIFKYVDDGSCFALELDYYGESIKIIKDYEFALQEYL